jgi:hypothetical protein
MGYRACQPQNVSTAARGGLDADSLSRPPSVFGIDKRFALHMSRGGKRIRRAIDYTSNSIGRFRNTALSFTGGRFPVARERIFTLSPDNPQWLGLRSLPDTDKGR